MKKIPMFYKDEPIFGIDIGHNNIKVVEIGMKHGKHVVKAYGMKTLDPALVDRGQITDTAKLSKELESLMHKELTGSIKATRAVIGLPARFAYSRTVFLPKLKADELLDAVRLEAEQSIPVPPEELYISYDVIEPVPKKEVEVKKGDKDTTPLEPKPVTPVAKSSDEVEVVINAAPRKLIDSYVAACELANIEVCAIETSLQSLNRLVSFVDDKSTTTLLIDIADTTIDLCVVDNVVRVTGAVQGGGDAFTNAIAKQVKISKDAATALKFKYGLNVSQYQNDITLAVDAQMQQLVQEIQKIMRFYEERAGADNGVKQIISTGGGAAMPGLSEYLIDHLRLPVRMVNVWQNMDFEKIEKPSIFRNSTYATAAGLALATPKEVYG